MSVSRYVNKSWELGWNQLWVRWIGKVISISTQNWDQDLKIIPIPMKSPDCLDLPRFYTTRGWVHLHLSLNRQVDKKYVFQHTTWHTPACSVEDFLEYLSRVRRQKFQWIYLTPQYLNPLVNRKCNSSEWEQASKQTKITHFHDIRQLYEKITILM